MFRRMIIAILKIFPRKEKRLEALDVLLSVKGPVLAEPGCLCCCLYDEHGEEPGILYIEQWRSMADMEKHLRSSSYGRILEAMELSTRLPELNFYETAKTWNFELVERMRGTDHTL
jgi:quinol monooxygenase YgiN